MGYPWFPAELMDDTVPEDSQDPIPPHILRDREIIEKRNRVHGQKTYLVRFFDHSASYTWLPASKLDILGVDDGEALSAIKSPCIALMR
jgi:hypothetical protein